MCLCRERWWFEYTRGHRVSTHSSPRRRFALRCFWTMRFCKCVGSGMGYGNVELGPQALRISSLHTSKRKRQKEQVLVEQCSSLPQNNEFRSGCMGEMVIRIRSKTCRLFLMVAFWFRFSRVNGSGSPVTGVQEMIRTTRAQGVRACAALGSQFYLRPQLLVRFRLIDLADAAHLRFNFESKKESPWTNAASVAAAWLGLAS
ncbi:hypothetical protein DFH08DRAFT_802337 [Mycena albidolilacea]|uniref:Uncharacterized protein n=1 Tax=Mycena albidolilacea TaxID=1033008 RepID=A0AAD7AHW1_9AGAR|nr:hypothetical protein DFH08DRAFT_802337 [Mycena albidolilacea]